MKNKIIKSNRGATMADLVAAITIFSIFTGIIGTLMYNAYKTNLQTKLAGTAVNYAVEILEDIDKISYDEVQNGMEEDYKRKLGISNKFNLDIDVKKYSQGTTKKDLIKQIKLTISYKFVGKTEYFIVENLKMKEI